MGKFLKLTTYLREIGQEQIAISFDDFSMKLGINLPPSASYRAYWANTPTHSISLAWDAAGYRVRSVDYKRRIVLFERKAVAKQMTLLSSTCLVYGLFPEIAGSAANFAVNLTTLAAYLCESDADPVTSIIKLRDWGVSIVDNDGNSYELNGALDRLARARSILDSGFDGIAKTIIANLAVNLAEKETDGATILEYVFNKLPFSFRFADGLPQGKSILDRRWLDIQQGLSELQTEDPVSLKMDTEVPRELMKTPPFAIDMTFPEENYMRQMYKECLNGLVVKGKFSINARGVEEMINAISLIQNESWRYYTTDLISAKALVSSARNRILFLIRDGETWFGKNADEIASEGLIFQKGK